MFSFLPQNLQSKIAQNYPLNIKQLEVERQVQTVIEADRNVKKMEKLRENQLEEYTKAEAKENQEFILETVSRKLTK